MGNFLTPVSDGAATKEIATRETASTAAAAQATAAVQARYVVALQRPRQWDMVRARLLKECDRRAFAECASYQLPRGGMTISGPSIRLAEAALRAMGNVLPEVQTIYDDGEKRIVRVSVTDLETNVTYTRDVSLAKTIERRTLRKGQTAISERTNSLGEKVFLVEATDDEMLMRENAATSRALRTLALRLLPGDLLDEAMVACDRTLARGDAADPEATRKVLLDSFMALGVTPADLADFLGHDTAMISPAELKGLRGAYSTLKGGETTWAEILDAKLQAETEAAGDGPASKTTRRKQLLADIAKARLRVSKPELFAETMAKNGIDVRVPTWGHDASLEALEAGLKALQAITKTAPEAPAAPAKEVTA